MKCRLVVMGFKHTFRDFDTCAGTISRSGQRLANVVAPENQEFTLFRFVVSQYFAKGGGAFETFSASSGQDIRNVEFDMLREDLECLRQLLDLF